ncbi:MAG TPA: MTAP family purine nucleoside phosphorylase [Galbitalea sp.]|jgi:5'-methylthioadenosine phosphorylase
MSNPSPTVAVIGGSGLYQLFPPAESTVSSVHTPYGTVRVTIGTFAGTHVAFITRHGSDHSVPPHLINYRANIWALASLGVRVILSSSAVGGLGADYPPGTLVLTDQFIDRTWGRADTFFDQGSVQHLASADPFDTRLHGLALDALEAAGETVAASGTVVVIQGPRFSTRAESRWFSAAGGDIVNMTMYPEVSLASELNLATVNLAFVTDSDAGAHETADDADAVSHNLVLERLVAAQPRIVAALETIVRALPVDFAAECMPLEAVAEILARPAAS